MDSNIQMVEIVFKDDRDSPLIVDIKLSHDFVESEDSNIFYYVSGLSELKELMKEDNNQDFIVKEIFN